MQLAKYSMFARKIHRFLVVFITLVGFAMMTTGYKMKSAGEGVNVLPFIDYQAARLLHNQLSTAFAFILAAMIVTGLFMYLYPWIMKLTRKNTP